MGLVTRKSIDQSGTRAGEEQRRCDGCHRTPLIGESVALYAGGELRCDQCREASRQTPVSELLVKHTGEDPRSRVRVIRRLPT